MFEFVSLYEYTTRIALGEIGKAGRTEISIIVNLELRVFDKIINMRIVNFSSTPRLPDKPLALSNNLT